MLFFVLCTINKHMTGQKGLIQTCSHFMFEIFFLTSNKKTISHVSVGRIYHLNISVRPAGNQCAKVELGILFLSVRIQLVRSGSMLKALDSSSSLCNLFLICFWGKVFVCLFFLLSI